MAHRGRDRDCLLHPPPRVDVLFQGIGFRGQGSGFRVQVFGVRSGSGCMDDVFAGQRGGGQAQKTFGARSRRDCSVEGSYLRLIDFCITQL